MTKNQLQWLAQEEAKRHNVASESNDAVKAQGTLLRGQAATKTANLSERLLPYQQRNYKADTFGKWTGGARNITSSLSDLGKTFESVTKGISNLPNAIMPDHVSILGFGG